METSTQSASHSILQNRTFRQMFIAYSLSVCGDWFDMMAITILIGFVWQAEPMVLALLPLILGVPGMLFGQIAGVLTDRWNKLRVLIIADLLSSVLTVGMVFAPNIVWLYGLLALRSLAGTFRFPAQQALTRHVVAPDQLLKATSLNSIVHQAGKVLGPLLGAGLVAWFEPQTSLVVNAVTFVLSAVLLMRIGNVEERRAESVQGKAEKMGFWSSWREGWQVLLGNRVVLVSVLFSLTASMTFMMVDFQFAVVFRQYAPNRPELMGWSMALIGLGSVCAIAAMNRLKEMKRYGLWLGSGYLVGSTFLIVIGLVVPGMSPLWILLASLIGGVGFGAVMVVSNYVMQKETPKEAIGRVSGIMNSLISVVLIISPVIGGRLVEVFGANQTFLMIGYALLVLGAFAILSQRLLWKRADQVVETDQSTVFKSNEKDLVS